MRRNFILSVLLAMMLVSGTAFGWGTTGGDGSDVRQLQETAVFFNNSGMTLWTGAVVILDLDSASLTTGTTLGSYVTLAEGVTDSRLVMGVVAVEAADQTPVVVITHGPADTSYQGATDGHTIVGDAVGTANKKGYAGAGSKLGFIMENVVTDCTEAWVWVNPHNSE